MPLSRVPTRVRGSMQLPFLLLLLTATVAFVQAFHRLPSLPRYHTSTISRTANSRTHTPPLTRRSLFSNPNHSPSSPPPPLTLPGTTLALRHPKTNSQVFIVGCVHGSEASEQDVTTVITGQDADIILLELCEDRFQSMQAEEAKQRARALAFQQQQEQQKKTTTPPSFPLFSTTGLSDFTTNLKEFFTNHGFLPTVLVVLLSSSAEVQRILTNTHTHNRHGERLGSRPSCEFRKSVELAEAQKAKIVLGDQDLSVTLQRFKDGLRPQWLGARGGADIGVNDEYDNENESFSTTSTTTTSKPSLLAEVASIRNAVLGPPGLPAGKKVDVLRLLFTQERYIRELVKVLVPVALVVLLTLQLLESAGDVALATLHHILPATFSSFFSLLAGATNGVNMNMNVDALSTTATTAATTSSSTSSTSALFAFLDSSTFEDLGWAAVNVLMVFYFLSLNRHILFERDAFLANSIAEAAGGKNEGKKVVAVLGLLHGNGVGRHLCEKYGFEIVERF